MTEEEILHAEIFALISGLLQACFDSYVSKMEFKSSPNFNARRGSAISHLVLHYTGMETASGAIARLCDPVAQVSAHYVVEENGRVTQLVDEARRAWHAGKSFWAGEADINSSSIGIEIVNPGHEFGYREFPKKQIKVVVELCRNILVRYPAILPHYVLAHSDIAPGRKMDPGELFPWKMLATDGVGIYPPDELNVDPLPYNEFTVADRLAAYGYNPAEMPGVLITAFQRHFRPALISGQWDDECQARLSWLLEQKHQLQL